ncbi:MAG: sigma-70 family RNA polymerase sigma factor, partial [Ktedonobacteraceae bacterium]|nr:sigma-70 family RNA polymerase sigma factor [Ktedonobacteraceae bacterium]
MTARMTFEELYATQFDFQVRHVQQRYDLSYDEAQDIVQVTFIQMWDKYPTFEGIPSPGGFLRTKVDYMVRTYFRQRHQMLSLDLP